jgi:5'-3' exonuclease
VRRCLLLVDGTALYVRSSRAGQRTGMNANGVPTGTLTLFTHSLARLLRAYRPSHVLAAFDGPGSRDWRRGLYVGYKGNRPDPPEYGTAEHDLVLRLCDAAGTQAISYAGFEADDVIAWGWRTWWAQEQPGDSEVVIASDDADMHQLLWGRTRQVPLSAGGQVMTRDSVVSRYGCEPDQLPRLRALAGDTSDGIPGVPGTGPVKALRILREHSWDLSAVTATMDQGQARLVGSYYDIIDLVKPIRAIDYERGMERYPFMEATSWSSGKAEGAADFFSAHQMVRTLNKLEAGSLW